MVSQDRSSRTGGQWRGLMDEVEKLKKLIPHWMEHNDEHAETYKDWAEKMSSLEKKELSEILIRLHQESRKLKALFKEAMRMIDV
jgi:hypothetical protein